MGSAAFAAAEVVRRTARTVAAVAVAAEAAVVAAVVGKHLLDCVTDGARATDFHRGVRGSKTALTHFDRSDLQDPLHCRPERHPLTLASYGP